MNAIQNSEALSASAADTSSAVNSASLIEYISFAIGDDQYGVEIMSVREIKGWSGVTHLPKQPEYVRGVLNLRGAMVPIVDLRRRFEQGITEATALHIVIIINVAGRLIGLLADRVLDIVSIDAGNIQPVPQMSVSRETKFLSGLVTVDDALLALIELENLLTADDAATDAGSQPAPVIQ